MHGSHPLAAKSTEKAVGTCFLVEGAHDACVLVGLNQSEGPVDVAAGLGRVVRDVLENALVVNNEQTAQSVSLLLEMDTVVLADSVLQVADDRNVHGAQSAHLARLLRPRQVREVRVNGRGDHLASRSNRGEARSCLWLFGHLCVLFKGVGRACAST